MAPHTYECTQCHRRLEAPAADPSAECCGRAMAALKMEQCPLATGSEHARFDDLDEPCDDGRAG